LFMLDDAPEGRVIAQNGDQVPMQNELGIRGANELTSAQWRSAMKTPSSTSGCWSFLLVENKTVNRAHMIRRFLTDREITKMTHRDIQRPLQAGRQPGHAKRYRQGAGQARQAREARQSAGDIVQATERR
jgi:hypothetical protein